jgi:hypothetical protein
MISFQSLIEAFAGILDLLFPLAVALALLFFLWGLAVFILASGDTKRIQEGKDKIKWGLIALFVMVSIWGIVSFFQGSIFGSSSVPGIRVEERGGYEEGGYFGEDPCPIEIQGTPECY